MPIADRVFGADGGTLARAWDDGMRALRGTSVAGFPNLCLIIGPNTGLGNNSMIHIIESQLNYMADYLATLDRLDAAALDARPARSSGGARTSSGGWGARSGPPAAA